MVTLRKIILLLLDMASTVLTLMTGLRENPVLVLLTSRYDLIRSRFEQRRINYDIVRDDHLDLSMLPELKDVATNYRFYSAPTRGPHNLAKERSTCRRVNSMNSTILTLNYDDFFGKGARREQIYFYSISAPHCRVINFENDWYEGCVNLTFAGNATACHEYIYHNFDDLYNDRQIQVGIPQDFGTLGTPFLRCPFRPVARFEFVTDLLVLQSYWAGGSFHVEVQSSRCWAVPRISDLPRSLGLFEVEPYDATASVVFAVEPASWVVRMIAVIYGVFSIGMILRGIFVALSMNNVVVYVPSRLRAKFFGVLQIPSIDLLTRIYPKASQLSMLICYGENLMASDLWMNNWLYITLSVLDALTSIRTSYIALEMGTWMLSNDRNLDNFIFVCSALTKLTWIMCFIHTLFRFFIKLCLHATRSISWLQQSKITSFINWYVDATALLMSYKLYSILLCGTLLAIYGLYGTPTLMVHQENYKQAVYGGFPNVSNFWGNEIICDLIVLCGVQLAAAHIISAGVLCTKYRCITYNRVLRLMQDRYVFVGWDVLVAMEALGIDPLDEDLVHDDVAVTNCSFGALIQQLYASGPSGYVEFIGDSVFTLSVTNVDEAREMRYPVEIAEQMGLFKSTKATNSSPIEVWHQTPSESIRHLEADMETPDDPDRHKHSMVSVAVKPAGGRSSFPKKRSVVAIIKENLHPSESASVRKLAEARKRASTLRLAERSLHIHAESRWGRLLLVDYLLAPGRLARNTEGTLLEFVVQDALYFLKKDEVRPMLSQDRRLHIC